MITCQPLMAYRLLSSLYTLVNLISLISFMPTIDGHHSAVLYLSSWSYATFAFYLASSTVLMLSRALRKVSRDTDSTAPCTGNRSSAFEDQLNDAIINGKSRALPLLVPSKPSKMSPIKASMKSGERCVCGSEHALTRLLCSTDTPETTLVAVGNKIISVSKSKSEGALQDLSTTSTLFPNVSRDRRDAQEHMNSEASTDSLPFSNNNNAQCMNAEEAAKHLLSRVHHPIGAPCPLASLREDNVKSAGNGCRMCHSCDERWQDVRVSSAATALIKCLMIAFNVSAASVPMVAAVYYGYAMHFYGRVTVSYADWSMHGMPCVVMAIELCITAFPLRVLHVLHPMAFGIIYVGSATAYWAADPSKNVLYPDILDWSQPGQTACFVVGGILLVIPVFLVMWGLVWLRRRVFQTAVCANCCCYEDDE